MRFVAAALEPAEALVNHRQQVRDAIGHRRVRGDRAFLRLAPHQPGFAALEGLLRIGDDVAQDVEFFGHRRSPAEDHLGELLEPEKPEGELERVRFDDHRMLGKGGGEFVVRIEDQHAQFRVGGDRLVEEQRHGGRLADAGGADDGEVFGKHRGHMDGGVEALVLGQLAGDAAVRLA